MLPARARYGADRAEYPARGFDGLRGESTLERIEEELCIPGLARMRPAAAGSAGWWARVGSSLQDLFLVLANFCIVGRLSLVPAVLSSRSASLAGATVFSRREFFSLLFLSGAFSTLLFKSSKSYRLQQANSALEQSLAVFGVTLIVTLLLLAFRYVSGMETVPPMVIVSAGLLNFLTLSGRNLLRRAATHRNLAQSNETRNVLIVGAGKVGRAIARFLEQNKQLGCQVHGFLDENHCNDVRVLGRIENLPQVARAHFIDEVIITIPSQRELVSEVVSEARRNRLDVKIVPDLYEDLCDGSKPRAMIEQMGKYPVLVLHRQSISAVRLFVKRALDLALGSLALMVLSPLFLAIAIAIKLNSRGPVLYRSYRLGKKGRSFACLKFRTMVTDADLLKHELRRLNKRQGPFFKLDEDPRITRVGKWLRKYSLDELPQFWNVIRGDMSLVGPRPHPMDDCALYRLEHLRRLDVTPGITGLWQVSSRRDPSFEKNMILDLQYIENWSLWLDIKILLKTLPAVIRAEGQ